MNAARHIARTHQAALAATPTPGFDREQWTTCYIQRLTVGDVFGAHNAAPHRPAVLTAITITPSRSEWDHVTGTGQYLDNSQEFTFDYRANTTVVVRCDLRYTVKVPPSEGEAR